MAYADLFSNDRLLLEFIASIESDKDINLLSDEEILSYADSLYKFTSSFEALSNKLKELGEDASEEDITFWSYECAKPYYGYEKSDLKKWFKHLYMIWTHKENGPRLGTFIRCFGIENFINLIEKKMNDPWRFTGIEEEREMADEAFKIFYNKCSLDKNKKYEIWCEVKNGAAKVYHEEV